MNSTGKCVSHFIWNFSFLHLLHLWNGVNWYRYSIKTELELIVFVVCFCLSFVYYHTFHSNEMCYHFTAKLVHLFMGYVPLTPISTFCRICKHGNLCIRLHFQFSVYCVACRIQCIQHSLKLGGITHLSSTVNFVFNSQCVSSFNWIIFSDFTCQK